MRNSREIPIVPVDKTFTEVKVMLDFVNFQLNALEANVYATFYDANNLFVERKIVYIPPDIYSRWGVDDDFIVEYVFSILNIQKAIEQEE